MVVSCASMGSGVCIFFFQFPHRFVAVTRVMGELRTYIKTTSIIDSYSLNCRYFISFRSFIFNSKIGLYWLSIILGLVPPIDKRYQRHLYTSHAMIVFDDAKIEK